MTKLTTEQIKDKWETWAGSFISECQHFGTQPLTENQVSYAFGVAKGVNEAQKAATKDFVESAPICRIIAGRAFVPIDHQVLVLLCLCISSPGTAVMWAHALSYYVQCGNTLDLTTFMRDVCPNGLLDDEQLSKFWDAQKTREGNLLDIYEGGAKA